MAIPLFDAHCDTLSRLLAEPEQHLLGNGGQWDLGLWGQSPRPAQIPLDAIPQQVMFRLHQK